jgi:anti-sigma regulatory factor (Ser/Thr protein kinase)
VFGQEDLALLEVAAARAAPGIERARLYSALEREHRVAVLLQRSLLPRALPDVVGVPVGARYLSARDEVGGDWYDVIELPEGRIGIAIGDVVGHGLSAAALMGQLRTALRAYAQEGHGPSRTLELVDRFVQTMPQRPMATAAYGQFDPDSGKLSLATAGHLPPAIVGPDGPRSVEVTPGAPLGAFPYGAAPEQELTLQSGEVLVMYTDGLVERRGEPLERGIAQLLELMRDATTAEEACQLAFDGLVPPEGLDDDVAIVALQNAPVPAALRLALAADPKVLVQVRRAIRRWLRQWGAGTGRSGEMALAVSEGCANAIEHAYAPGAASFEVQAEVVDGEAVFTVRDWGRWRPTRRRNRGRGFRIIEAAMDDVRIETTATGTTIVMRRRLRAG